MYKINDDMKRQVEFLGTPQNYRFVLKNRPYVSKPSRKIGTAMRHLLELSWPI